MLAIVGPTAVGKTELALRLADYARVEIVSADSRQVYKYMDIGTAKPTAFELSSVRHHLVDLINPDEEFGLAQFLDAAKSAMDSVRLEGAFPVVVGGTGQYIWALLEGWNVPRVAPDHDLRRRLNEQLNTDGIASLVSLLGELDPQASSRVDLGNPRRIIRAIEVAAAGETSGSRPRRTPPSFQTRIIGLTMERPPLYQRIDQRVDRMMQAGFLREVRSLLDMGFSVMLPSMSSVGYGELADHLIGEIELSAAVHKIKMRTHRLARRQSAWFKSSDSRIHWYDSSDFSAALEDGIRWIDESCESVNV